MRDSHPFLPLEASLRFGMFVRALIHRLPPADAAPSRAPQASTSSRARRDATHRATPRGATSSAKRERPDQRVRALRGVARGETPTRARARGRRVSEDATTICRLEVARRRRRRRGDTRARAATAFLRGRGDADAHRARRVLSPDGFERVPARRRDGDATSDLDARRTRRLGVDDGVDDDDDDDDDDDADARNGAVPAEAAAGRDRARPERERRGRGVARAARQPRRPRRRRARGGRRPPREEEEE